MNGAFAPVPVGRTGRRSPIGPVIVAIVAFIALAVLKPWAGPTPAGVTPLASATGSAEPTATTDAAEPVESGLPPVVQALRAVCLAPSGWRVTDIERWRGATIRSWKAITPVPASDPADPAIPTIFVPAEAIPALGYCAPTGPGVSIPENAELSIWVRTGDGSYVPAAPALRLLPTMATVGGALLAPPGRGSHGGIGSTRGWPAGRFVFALRQPNGTWNRWWAVEVRILPALAPSTAPSTAP